MPLRHSGNLGSGPRSLRGSRARVADAEIPMISRLEADPLLVIHDLLRGLNCQGGAVACPVARGMVPRNTTADVVRLGSLLNRSPCARTKCANVQRSNKRSAPVPHSAAKVTDSSYPRACRTGGGATALASSAVISQRSVRSRRCGSRAGSPSNNRPTLRTVFDRSQTPAHETAHSPACKSPWSGELGHKEFRRAGAGSSTESDH